MIVVVSHHIVSSSASFIVALFVSENLGKTPPTVEKAWVFISACAKRGSRNSILDVSVECLDFASASRAVTAHFVVRRLPGCRSAALRAGDV